MRVAKSFAAMILLMVVAVALETVVIMLNQFTSGALTGVFGFLVGVYAGTIGSYSGGVVATNTFGAQSGRDATIAALVWFCFGTLGAGGAEPAIFGGFIGFVVGCGVLLARK